MPETLQTIKIIFLHRPPLHSLSRRSAGLKWFSGLFTGHVGIEFNPGEIVNFFPEGRFHWIANNQHPHARFVIHTPQEFRRLYNPDAFHLSIFYFQIPLPQQQMLEKIIESYTHRPPYDYAFLGMRCASATYEIMARAGILQQASWLFLVFRFFTPGLLKQYLRKQAIFAPNKTIQKPM